jgi:hypothetical protein
VSKELGVRPVALITLRLLVPTNSPRLPLSGARFLLAWACVVVALTRPRHTQSVVLPLGRTWPAPHGTSPSAPTLRLFARYATGARAPLLSLPRPPRSPERLRHAREPPPAAAALLLGIFQCPTVTRRRGTSCRWWSASQYDHRGPRCPGLSVVCRRAPRRRA